MLYPVDTSGTPREMFMNIGRLESCTFDEGLTQNEVEETLCRLGEPKYSASVWVKGQTVAYRITELVRGLCDGAYRNLGLGINTIDTSPANVTNTYYSFASREYTEFGTYPDAHGPRLEIVYSVP